MTERDLVNYLEDRAGEYHQGTIRYTRDDFDILHLREDVRETYLTSRIARILRRVRPESSIDETRSFQFGELTATVRLFEEVIIIHFPRGNERGVVVSLEPETASNLSTFVSECINRIQE